jgi:hypothetical protein
MVAAADGEIKTDHIMGERKHGINAARTRMIAHPCAHPRESVSARLFDCRHGRNAHDQVTHPVVAIDERGRRPLVHEADVRAWIGAAGRQAT